MMLTDVLIERGIKEELVKIEEDRIFYLIQGKDYDFTHPEEPIRARTYCDLVYNLKYPAKRIDFEIVAPARVPPYPADIVVYEDDEKEHAYIVIETKATSSEASIEEAKREGSARALKLVLDGHGSFLGMEKGCFIVRDKEGNVKRYPLFEQEIGEVILKSGNMVSTGALASLGFWDIDVLVLTQKGKPVAMLRSLEDDSHVKTRVCQYEALKNGKGIEVAKRSKPNITEVWFETA